jgi:uncharacterized protein YfaS (alpha-2-macroglobulin family)
MARPNRSTESPEAEYAGEVWTDARGRATVTLPDPAAASSAYRYEIRSSDARVGARVVSELIDGRFTIETDEPNVRVAWRARARAGGKRQGEEA